MNPEDMLNQIQEKDYDTIKVRTTPYHSKQEMKIEVGSNRNSPKSVGRKQRDLFEEALLAASPNFKPAATMTKLQSATLDEYNSIPRAKMTTKSNVSLNKSAITAKSTKQSNLEQSIRDKLSYDWKAIYRRLNASDTEGTGKVNVRNFEKTLK